MISLIISKLDTDLTQKVYDDYIDSIDVHNLRCTCGRCNSTIHGYYTRNIKTSKGIIKLTVLRIKCKECNKTHSILLTLIVPYQQIQLNIQINIINNIHIDQIMINNPFIDEQCVQRVKKRYKSKYLEFMKSNKLSFDDDLVLESYKCFKSNFMQTHKGLYILNITTT